MRSVPIGSEQATNTRVDHMAKTQSPCIFCIVYDFFSVPTHSKWRAARNSLKRTRFYSRTSAEMFLLSPRRCSTLILSLSPPFLFVRKSLEVIFFVSTSRYLSVADIEWCLCCLYFLSGLFWRIHQMDPYSSGIMFAVMTLISTWLVAYAYKNVKFQLKHK